MKGTGVRDLIESKEEKRNGTGEEGRELSYLVYFTVIFLFPFIFVLTVH